MAASFNERRSVQTHAMYSSQFTQAPCGFDFTRQSPLQSSMVMTGDRPLSELSPLQSPRLLSRCSLDASAPLNPTSTTTRGTIGDAIGDRLLLGAMSPSRFLNRNRAVSSDKLTPVGVNANNTPLPTGGSARQLTWLRKNVNDRDLRSTLRSALADRKLDREDMLTAFADVADGKVTRTLFRDLKRIVDGASILNMPDYVEVLSDKIINGDYANRRYQEKPLGDLKAGSSGSHLRKLVDKWLLGGDRPLAESYFDDSVSYQYKLAKKPLFHQGISHRDIEQGQTGDCYLLGSLASVAVHRPNLIRDMFVDNGDRTYTIRFFNRDGEADYVTVDQHLPVSATGAPVYADYAKELWVALIEKAYAQLNESGWIGHSDSGWDFRPDDKDTNSYQGISGGLPDETTEQITGRSMTWSLVDNAKAKTVVHAFNRGKFVTLGSYQPKTQTIVPGHAYTLVDYNAKTRKFTLYNPWGDDGSQRKQDRNPWDGELTLSWRQVKQDFYALYQNV